MLMYNKKPIRDEEKGFASIVIALIMIVVLALLTVGFAQLTRREQQAALDKQLAAQATYAAESGINDAYKDITDGKITTANASPTSCMTSPALGSTSLTAHPTLNSADSVSYSCLLVNLTPNSLERSLDANGAWNTTFSVPPASAASSITVNWNSADGKTPWGSLPSSRDFTSLANWTAPAVLQFSVTPLGAVDRASLINNTFTTYMYPSSSAGGTVAYTTSATGQGAVVSGGCGRVTGSCKVVIRGLPGTNGESYLIHALDYYDPSHLTITVQDSSGKILNLSSSQAMIDVTGKAKDVLKRLQVRVPIPYSGVDLPNAAIEAQNVCKRFMTAPYDAVNNPAGTQFIDPSGAAASGTNPCYLE